MGNLYEDAMVLAGIRLAEKSSDFFCGGVRHLCEKGWVDAPLKLCSPLSVAYGKNRPAGPVEKRPLEQYEVIIAAEGEVNLP